jgi:hypothetical protein
MKKYLLLWGMLCLHAGLKAQTAEEWLRQKETALKYALEQLAAWQWQGSVVRKGYGIAGAGLQTLAIAKAEDDLLHRAFFASLKKIAPAIRSVPSLHLLSRFQERLMTEISRANSSFKTSAYLTGEERKFGEDLLGQLRREAGQQVTDLEQVLTPGKLQMTDAERLKRFAAIEQATLNIFGCLFTLQQQGLQLAKGREAEKRNTNQIKKMRGL